MRISLSADPVEEVKVARELLKSISDFLPMQLRSFPALHVEELRLT